MRKPRKDQQALGKATSTSDADVYGVEWGELMYPLDEKEQLFNFLKCVIIYI